MKPDLLYNMDPFKPNDSYLTKLFPREAGYLHFKASTIDSDSLFQAPLLCTLLSLGTNIPDSLQSRLLTNYQQTVMKSMDVLQ